MKTAIVAINYIFTRFRSIIMGCILGIVGFSFMSCTFSEVEGKNRGDDFVVVVTTSTDSEMLERTLGANVLHTLEIEGRFYLNVVGIKEEILRAYQNVVQVEQNYERYPFVISDPGYSLQYAPQQAELEDVWDTHKGQDVVVAVIDTGINTKHIDFGGVGTFLEGWKYDDSEEGEKYKPNDHFDINGHGTHVAGIIGARINDIGVVGVAPNAVLIPYKGTDENGYFLSFNVADSIKRAVDNGADVINMSLGGVGFAFIEMDAIRYAIDHDVVVVAAMGNDGNSVYNFPASYPGVIAVTSTNGKEEVSLFSTRSKNVSIGAPGEDIVSTAAGAPGSGNNSFYMSNSGTSMAAPFVAGVVALLKQKFSQANPAQIKEILENTAKDIDISGFDSASGYGLVQPKAALAVTQLPNVSFQKVTFAIRATNLDNPYTIAITSAGGFPVYYVLTDSQGDLSVYLKSGNYSFVSANNGVPFNGTFTVDTQAITINKNF